MADHQLLSIHKFIVDSLKRIIAGIMFDAFDLLLFLLFLLNCWGVGSAILFIFIFIDNWNIVWRFCAIKCKNVTGLTFYSSWWALDFFSDGNFQQRQTGAQCTALHCSYIYASEIISFVDKMKKEEKKINDKFRIGTQFSQCLLGTRGFEANRLKSHKYKMHMIK